MSTDPSRFEIRLDADKRLIAGVTGAVGFLAHVAGLGEPALSGLQSATARALREAISQVEGPMPLTVAISLFTDRIEVEVAHAGAASPLVGLSEFAALEGSAQEGSSNPFVSGGVDRVQHESQGATALTRLTKYLESPSPTT